ncbi:hypothetical protein [uncultured Anaerococcus sp.]|uniref:hypothetical protein n=1 Tax=uncultured Anaerococcus sp. TaxID=293428 RepID=UPI00280B0D86|nr:hypothetical protein [uncultured Anaerococcus sp.]
MLTFESAVLLHNLKQIDNPYIFDTNDLENQALIVNYKTLKFVKSSYYTYDQSCSLIARIDELKFLKENEYLEIDNKSITFTHKGYRPYQISFINLCNFLNKSILVPIIVTILTDYFLNRR